VAMTVVDVGIVLMAMAQLFVCVEMAVRLVRRCSGQVGVLVVLVVPVAMIVRETVVLVLMLVTLGDVKPHADRHQRAASDHPTGQRLTKDENAGDRADKGSRGVVRRRAPGAEVAQRENEQDQAQP
jgi:hypothetical protein